MKLLPSKYDIGKEKHLATMMLLAQDEKCVLILDTNILTWLYHVNKKARRELIGWFEELKHENLIAVTSWSIHEYNNHLTQSKDEVFYPFGILNKKIHQNLSELKKHASLIASEEIVSGSPFKNKHELLKEVEKATKEIDKITSCLCKVKKDNLKEVRLELETLLDGIIIDSDIYQLEHKVNEEQIYRFRNRIPPGYKDQRKEENAIGDLIIWNEILDYCSAEKFINCVFLTLDNKTDWISYPESIIVEETSKFRSYNKTTDRKYVFTHPSLTTEFKNRVNPNGEFKIINIEFLTEILSKMTWDQLNHSRFQNLETATKVYWQKSATDLVIKWLVENPEIVSEGLKGVCEWTNSPGEVDQSEFRKWMLTKELPEVKKKDIDWMQVFISHFI